jgi:iron only hydrogenase large subunit-like protein
VVFAGAKIKIGEDGSYTEELSDGTSKKLEKAQITLADCLACSGCITSAESVLIEQQSSEQLDRLVATSKHKRFFQVVHVGHDVVLDVRDHRHCPLTSAEPEAAVQPDHVTCS